MGADDEFVREAFAEISEIERDEIRRNARVVAALRTKAETYGVVDIGEERVRFKKTINKSLRRKLATYRTMSDSLKTSDIAQTERMVYDIISSLCVDEPWTSPNTWSVYDDEATVGTEEILVSMMSQITAHIEDVKNFRSVKGGSDTV